MITEKEFKERCAKIIRDNIRFSHQINNYIIHGALDALWKLHTEQTGTNTHVNVSFIPRPPEPPKDRIRREDGKGLIPPKNYQ